MTAINEDQPHFMLSPLAACCLPLRMNPADHTDRGAPCCIGVRPPHRFSANSCLMGLRGGVADVQEPKIETLLHSRLPSLYALANTTQKHSTSPARELSLPCPESFAAAPAGIANPAGVARQTGMLKLFRRWSEAQPSFSRRAPRRPVIEGRLRQLSSDDGALLREFGGWRIMAGIAPRESSS